MSTEKAETVPDPDYTNSSQAQHEILSDEPARISQTNYIALRCERNNLLAKVEIAQNNERVAGVLQQEAETKTLMLENKLDVVRRAAVVITLVYAGDDSPVQYIAGISAVVKALDEDGEPLQVAIKDILAQAYMEAPAVAMNAQIKTDEVLARVDATLAEIRKDRSFTGTGDFND